ncbi:MAG TPA: chemotaxis protein CheD [Rhizomicrobium sp.]|jgi:chemotaxis protein CheD|nr:chemotaxis protein CheD [Rhizomicrobium sp.]
MLATAASSRASARPSIRRYHNAQDGCWHVQLTQGDMHVTGEANEVLTTILGSCIAACIRDRDLGIGGMNHFLLPEGDAQGTEAQRYGVYAMELLINAILSRGARRDRLEAKLFGGANVLAGVTSIGTRNAAFAREFLSDEGIAVIGGNVGGTSPRRILYWPHSGRARQLLMPTKSVVIETELRKAKTESVELEGRDSVEFF